MLQSLIHAIYPPQCVLCDTRTEIDFALCGSCWAETPFIDGGCCDCCGVPLPAFDVDDVGTLCDDCMAVKRPWSKGRAALVYNGNARRLVLSLKHSDRTDLSRVVTPWMARAGREIMKPETLIVPIPLHRFRLLKRKFNQAALLAGGVAKVLNLDILSDGLIRSIRTKPLEDQSREQRFSELQGAIVPNPKRTTELKGRQIVLVDDVMTSGATFAAAAEACFTAGADDVCVLALARVVKDA